MNFLTLLGGCFFKVKGFLFFFLTKLIIDVPGICAEGHNCYSDPNLPVVFLVDINAHSVYWFMLQNLFQKPIQLIYKYV
jgi:hypothetical protein